MEIQQEKTKQDEPTVEQAVEQQVEEIELDPLFEEIAHFVVQLQSS
jgi:hypothetical protein